MRAAAAWRRRRSISAWLGRIDRALDEHDLYDAAQALAPDARPRVSRPLLGRRGLTAIRTRLLEELAMIDEPCPSEQMP